MASVNKVILIGNLGRDPEIRSTQDGTKIANLSLATSESWKDKNTGDRREKSEWHRVVIFGPLAEIAEKYLHKGSKIYVEGQIQTRKWTDQTGQDKYTTEIVLQRYRGELVMMDGKPEQTAPQSPGDQAAALLDTVEHEKEVYDPGRQGPLKGGADLDDEIPF